MMRVDKSWPAQADATHLGKRIPRLDGPDKVSGRAKYTFDINRPNMVWGKFALAWVGHAKVKSIDLSAAKAVKGCVYAELEMNPGDSVQFPGQPVAIVCGETEEAAREAAKAVKVEWELLPHNHQARELEAVAGTFRKDGRERKDGDPDQAFKDADAVIEGNYGCEMITHCCLESHGVVVELDGEDKATVWISTQNVSGIAEQAAGASDVPVENIHVICQHLGGGFGSKFEFDCGPQAFQAAKKLKRPVKLMLERDQELMFAGSRPSAFARVKVGVKKDGTITAWESLSWGTDGPGGRQRLSLPYVFKFPNSRSNNSSIVSHTSPARAWRAPNHPQQCLVTMAALEDAAAKIGMDPLEMFRLNIKSTGNLAPVYEEELSIAADLIGWKSKWKPRGSGNGVVRSGLGLSLHTWGGGGHGSNNEVTIRSDGTVETRCGTQDLGVGSRTVIGIVVADALGLPLDAVKVFIGENRYPASGASGGSTTVGGISSAARTGVVAALNKLMEKVAPELGAKPDELEAKNGRIQVKADPSKSMAWADACKWIGPTPIVANGATDAKLMNSGVGGVQMAEVEVDIETGVVAMKNMVAVQDCGTIIDLMTTESQVYGACIMGITSALYEEVVMDPVTGTCLNPDLEFYRLAGIADIGEIKVHMMMTEQHWKRGVIGIGEPPAVSPMAAISNAVANALGVRVPVLPMVPREVLRALGKGGAS